MIKVDNFGPEYAIQVSDAETGMVGFLVIDNTKLGPGKGGMRMSADVSMEEVFRLARTMTWKNSLFDLPFGGAKSGIIWKGGNPEQKEQIVRAFARAIKPFIPDKYIAGPDVNTGESEMVYLAEEIGQWHSTTGKPKDYCECVDDKCKCGLPHEFGSTGFGVAEATMTTARIMNLPKDATVAIHGFGNVGTFAYKFLTEAGYKVRVLADAKSAVTSDHFDPKEIEQVIAHKLTLSEMKSAQVIPNEDFWAEDVDILIPASVTNVINESNFGSIRAKLIVEGGNIPMTEEIENKLMAKGIVIVPDFVANGGGVISSYVEYKGGDKEEMFKIVKEKINSATEQVMSKSIADKLNPRTVALEIAKSKL